MLYIQGSVAIWTFYVPRLAIGFWVGIAAWPRRWWLRGPLLGALALLGPGLLALGMPQCGSGCMARNIAQRRADRGARRRRRLRHHASPPPGHARAGASRPRRAARLLPRDLDRRRRHEAAGAAVRPRVEATRQVELLRRARRTDRRRRDPTCRSLMPSLLVSARCACRSVEAQIEQRNAAARRTRLRRAAWRTAGSEFGSMLRGGRRPPSGCRDSGSSSRTPRSASRRSISGSAVEITLNPTSQVLLMLPQVAEQLEPGVPFLAPGRTPPRPARCRRRR